MLGEKPECRRLTCLCDLVLELCPLVGVTVLSSESSPQSALGLGGYLLSLGCLEHPKRLQFCHWFLVYMYFFSFHQGTHHMNQPLSILWHFKWIKRCFCSSVLQNNAVLLHLKNTCVFCGMGLLSTRKHMCFHVILLEWALGGLHWREESKIGSNVWMGWQREIRKSLVL